MSAETLFGLIFITTAMFAMLFTGVSAAGVFDIIEVKICNYIVSRMERIEGKDI